MQITVWFLSPDGALIYAICQKLFILSSEGEEEKALLQDSRNNSQNNAMCQPTKKLLSLPKRREIRKPLIHFPGMLYLASVQGRRRRWWLPKHPVSFRLPQKITYPLKHCWFSVLLYHLIPNLREHQSSKI